MTATTSQELAGNARTVRDGVPRVVGGRGWRGGEQREGTAWRPAVDISERRDAYRASVVFLGALLFGALRMRRRPGNSPAR